MQFTFIVKQLLLKYNSKSIFYFWNYFRWWQFSEIYSVIFLSFFFVKNFEVLEETSHLNAKFFDNGTSYVYITYSLTKSSPSETWKSKKANMDISNFKCVEKCWF